MKIEDIYIVQAYRYANLEGHSYIVAACGNLKRAKILAEREEAYRGGKYSCVVYKKKLNSWDDETWSWETPQFKREKKDIKEVYNEFQRIQSRRHSNDSPVG